MEGSGAGPRLIIVCGLPGSGKTTLAKALEGRLRAVRFSPDEWLDALSINLHCEETREKIEALRIYQNSATALDRAQGTILQSHSIVIEDVSTLR